MNVTERSRAAHHKFFPPVKPINIMRMCKQKTIEAPRARVAIGEIAHRYSAHVNQWRKHIAEENKNKPTFRMSIIIKEVAEKRGLTVERKCPRRVLQSTVMRGKNACIAFLQS